MLTCLTSCVWLTCPLGIGSGLLAGPPPGQDGRGVKKRGTMWHYLQPDYILAQAEGMGMFTGMGFCFPQFLHFDHCTIVAVVRVGGGGLAEEVMAQAPDTSAVPAAGAKADTTAFDILPAKCVDPKPMRKPGKDWISKAMWRLIAKQASLFCKAAALGRTPHGG